MAQTLNLGRVQGVSIFYSTGEEGTNVFLNQIKPDTITPMAGDYILFSNGNVRVVTQVYQDSVACGEKQFSLKGEKGVGVSMVEQTQTSSQSGGTNVVRFTLEDGTHFDAQIQNGKDGADGIDGVDGKNGLDGTNGKDGTSVGITLATTEYQVSADGVSPPSGSWLQSIPVVGKGQYLWTKTVVAYTNGTSTTTYTVGYVGLDGTNGKDGVDGIDGANGKDGVNGKDGLSVISASLVKMSEGQN